MNSYSFISRFLDNDIPSVTSSFKEFLLKDGLLPMLLSFITQNFPKSIQSDIDNLKRQQYTERMNKIKELKTQYKEVNGAGEGLSGLSFDKMSLNDSLLAAEIPIETIKSKKVMDLFIHPSPPFISLIKEKLPMTVSSLFEIFEILDFTPDTSSDKQPSSTITTTTAAATTPSTTTTPLIPKPKPNICHFCKILNCLFYQFTFEFVYQLSEVSASGKTYFQILIDHLHIQPIQDFFVIVAKRASSSVSEYQTVNPIDTKKIQKALQKSKIFNTISNIFLQFDHNPVNTSSSNLLKEFSSNNLISPIKEKKEKEPKDGKEKEGKDKENKEKNKETATALKPPFREELGEGIGELIIKIIEELDIHGPDNGISIFCFQTKDFVDSLVKIMYNESRKNSFNQMKLALAIIMAYFKQSIDYTERNEFQKEKDSLLSPSSTSSWVLYFSINHLQSICKIMIDIGNNPNLKKNLTSYRLDTFTLLIEMIRARTIFKKKTLNQPYLPVELWYFLVDWFFQFNNIYHSKFFQFIQEIFSQGHIPSMKHFCSTHLKRFISFYLSEKNSSATNQSECIGIILLICNYIRITSATLPVSHFLPSFLSTNDQWQKFLPTLYMDTINQYTDIQITNIKDAQSKSYLIDFGSPFADSIGFEDEEKKLTKPINNTGPLMVDEFNSSSSNGNNFQKLNEQESLSSKMEDDEKKKNAKKNKK